MEASGVVQHAVGWERLYYTRDQIWIWNKQGITVIYYSDWPMAIRRSDARKKWTRNVTGRTDTQVKPPEYIPSFLHCHSACKDCSTQFDPGEIWSDQSSVSQVTATRRWKTGSPPFLQKKLDPHPTAWSRGTSTTKSEFLLSKEKKTKSEFQLQEHKAVDRPVVVQSVNCHAPVLAQSCKGLYCTIPMNANRCSCVEQPTVVRGVLHY
jgi:hypothetical protein